MYTYKAGTHHTKPYILSISVVSYIHIMFVPIFDFHLIIVICLQKSGVSTQNGCATLPKQLPIHPVKTADDPTTPMLGNPASEIGCIECNFMYSIWCCLVGPKELPQQLVILFHGYKNPEQNGMEQ